MKISSLVILQLKKLKILIFNFNKITQHMVKP